MLRLRELMPDTRFIVAAEAPDRLEGKSQVNGPTNQYFEKSASRDDVLGEIRRLFPEVFGKALGRGAPIERRQALRSEHATQDDEICRETSTSESQDPREASC